MSATTVSGLNTRPPWPTPMVMVLAKESGRAIKGTTEVMCMVVDVVVF